MNTASMNGSSNAQIISIQISILFTYYIFLLGYFPIKENMPGFATTDNFPPYPIEDSQHIPGNYDHLLLPSFDRLVIVLIDALRQDFVFSASSPMNFTKNLIETRQTTSIIGRAQSPTVTMPRIKALVSGNIPGFIDVVLNVGSSQFKGDNLISQLKRRRKTLIHFGDDTWLNLFPDHFTRSDGTTSFFVNDYTEVDANVTRHLTTELEASDWDVMILHYLGLDHIGHIAGPKSPLINSKLKEMDSVIEMIYTKLMEHGDRRKSLILVCGDHGMSEGGSHGGGSNDETLVPMLLLNLPGQADITTIRDQIDIVPTLSLLFALPIPNNNLGIIVSDAFQFMDIKQQVRIHQINAYQLLNVLKLNTQDVHQEKGLDLYTRATNTHKRWLSNENNVSQTVWIEQGRQAISAYNTASLEIKDRLMSSLLTYDMYAILVAILCISMVTLLLLTLHHNPIVHVPLTLTHISLTLLSLFAHITVCTSAYHSPVICGLHMAAAVAQLCVFGSVLIFVMHGYMVMTTLRTCIYSISTGITPMITTLLWTAIALHSLTLLSSSFVEEEHQTWYFYATTVHVFIFVTVIVKKSNIDGCTTFGNTLETNICGDVDRCKNVDFLDREISNTTKTASNYENNENVLASTYQNENTPNLHPNVRENKSGHNMMCKLRDVIPVSVMLVGCRISRSWNQTGDKWLGTPDIKLWLIMSGSATLTSIIIVSIIAIIIIRHLAHRSYLTTLSLLIGLAAVYCFRSANETTQLHKFCNLSQKGITEARISFVCIATICLEITYTTFTTTNKSPRYFIDTIEKFTSAWLLFTCLVLRLHNIPLVAIVCVMETVVCRYLVDVKAWPTVAVAIYHVIMAQAAFFYQGNSNKLATLDLSSAFVAMETYQPTLGAMILALATYSKFLLWMISLLKIVVIKSAFSTTDSLAFRKRLAINSSHVTTTLSLSYAIPILIYTILTTHQRYHLFVWTVFSPKLLYQGMLTVIVTLFCWTVMFVFRGE